MPEIISRRGAFIAIVAPDGAGKSTIVEALRHIRPTWVYTREPFNKPPAQLNNTLLRERWFTQDRAEHVARVIGPALDAGHTVVSDRYFACTAAYQATSDRGAAAIFNDQAAKFPRPDLWVYVDTNEIARAVRLASRGEAAPPAGVPQRYEHLRAAGLMQPCAVVTGNCWRSPSDAATEIVCAIEGQFRMVAHSPG